MTSGYAKSVREHASQAEMIDNYHVAALATKARGDVHRERWNKRRQTGQADAAHQLMANRSPLLKNPDDLTERQPAVLAAIPPIPQRAAPRPGLVKAGKLGYVHLAASEAAPRGSTT